jgi:hypothetical protein
MKTGQTSSKFKPMIWIPLLVIGLLIDIGNLSVIYMYRRGKAGSPVPIAPLFYVPGIVAAVWLTSYGPEWIGVWIGVILIVLHGWIISFWYLSPILKRRKEWLERATLSELNAEKDRSNPQYRGPWLRRP